MTKMTKEPTTLDLLESYQAKQQPVDLTIIRQRASELRDAYLKQADLKDQLDHVHKAITHIEREELPEMFTQAGISSLTVEGKGNHPPFVAERGTVYNAKIPEDKRQEALEWFAQTGNGDLVKSVINIFFGMQEYEERLRIMKILDDAGVQYYTNESIHHQTLKAFVKREIQAGHTVPMDLLGVFVFDEVKIK
jgi:hypothetical protein